MQALAISQLFRRRESELYIIGFSVSGHKILQMFVEGLSKGSPSHPVARQGRAVAVRWSHTVEPRSQCIRRGLGPSAHFQHTLYSDGGAQLGLESAIARNSQDFV